MLSMVPQGSKSALTSQQHPETGGTFWLSLGVAATLHPSSGMELALPTVQLHFQCVGDFLAVQIFLVNC